jgi:hypothetical protein
VQYDKSLTGFTKLAYYLFGQGGWAVMSYLAAPEWFWEGEWWVFQVEWVSFVGWDIVVFYCCGEGGCEEPG